MTDRKTTAAPHQETSWLKSAPKPTALLHPLVIFSAVWLGVVFLYSLRLSLILRYSSFEALSLVLWLWLPLAAAIGIYSFLHWLSMTAYPRLKQPWNLDFTLLRRRLKLCFRFWIGITIVEVVISGGVPIVWALTGNTKTYADFGVPSLHGFVNSLQEAIALCYFVLFLITKERRELKIPAFFLFWTIVIINRNMMLVTLLEFAVMYVRLRKVRFATFAQIGSGILMFVLAFGVIGDIRQGKSGLIRDLAQPTEAYPEWLPSGVLWAYIYITTPINNLLYTAEISHPVNNALFPSTVSTLFPSVLRTAIYGDTLGDAESGSVVISAFNVSTAYVGPYQDFGFIGTSVFSAFIGIITLFFWFRDDLRSILMFAVMTQCLVLTLFFDHFFYLPVITQLGWLWYFFTARHVVIFVPDTWKKSTLRLRGNS
jgi:hypothetical protein